MNKSSSVKSILALFVVAVAAFVLVVSDIVVAQNTNSSATAQDENANTTNMNRRGRRGRRGRAASNANTSTDNMNTSGGDANMAQDAGTQDDTGTPSANTSSGTRRGRRGRRGRRNTGGTTTGTTTDTTTDTTTGTTTDTGGTSGGGQERGGTSDPNGNMSREEVDLSGTYTGNMSMPEHNMSGEATLTITGNSYTLQAGAMTHSGRFIAVMTRGYIGVAMELGPTEAGQPVRMLSLRARRARNRLTLTSVPGERTRFTFTGTSQ